MTKLQLTVVDEAGGKETKVKSPDQWTTNKLVDIFVKKMNLKTVSRDGQPISYQATLKRTGETLEDKKTLADSGVKDGDVIRLSERITHGMVGI